MGLLTPATGEYSPSRMFTLLLVACSAETEPTESPAGEDGRVFVDTGEPEAPALQLAEVGAFLNGRFAETAPSAGSMAVAYTELMGHRTLTCPKAEYATLKTWVVWAAEGEDCTTEDGWVFSGLANAQGACEKIDGGTMVDVGVLASFQVTDPDGLLFYGGGSFNQRCEWTDAEGWCDGALTGAFGYGAVEGWLGEGIDSSVFVTDTWVGEDHELTYSGGLGFADGDVTFQELVVNAQGATGGLSVRDPTGYWHELEFAENGGGCGQLRWRGQPEGELCLDLSVWRAPIERVESTCPTSP